MLSRTSSSKPVFGGRLSPAELAGYERDGFLRLPGFFSPAEIEPLAREQDPVRLNQPDR